MNDDRPVPRAGGGDGIVVNRRLVIPASELDYRFTTSSGPGGQHANKASTRVELLWNVKESRALSERQRRIILSKLRHRIDKSGTLRLAGERHRSQTRNRHDVAARLGRMVDEALQPERRRVATTPSRAAKRKRVEQKRQRGEIKKLRGSIPDE